MFEVLKDHTGNRQRSTSLKWENNGELSANDRSNLMKLLCQVDTQACTQGLCDANLYDENSQRLTQRRRRVIRPLGIPLNLAVLPSLASTQINLFRQ